MRDYKELKVWEKAHETVLSVYKLTEKFPKEELYGLTSQMRRCAVSVPANIAEGRGRRTNGEMTQFLSHASGSAFELDYYFYLAKDLEMIKPETYQELHKKSNEVCKMLNSFISTLTPNT